MMQRLATIALALVASTAFAQEPTGDPSIIPAGAKLEVLFDGAFFFRGGQPWPSMARFTSATLPFPWNRGCRPGTSGATIPRPDRLRFSARPSGMSNGLKFDAMGRADCRGGRGFWGAARDAH